MKSLFTKDTKVYTMYVPEKDLFISYDLNRSLDGLHLIRYGENTKHVFDHLKKTYENVKKDGGTITMSEKKGTICNLVLDLDETLINDLILKTTEQNEAVKNLNQALTNFHKGLEGKVIQQVQIKLD